MAQWFNQHEPGGLPIEKAAIGVRDLSVLFTGSEVAVARQVKLAGHDIARGMGPDSAGAKLQAVTRYLAD